MPLSEQRVYCATAPRADYGAVADLHAPELETPIVRDSALAAIRSLFAGAQLDADRLGTPDWNPLGDVIARGSRVLIKPNWVRDRHLAGGDLSSVVTHTSVIAAILRYVFKAGPARVIVADAPVQGCDFDALRAAAGLDELAEIPRDPTCDFAIRDLRRTIRESDALSGPARTDCRALEHYVLFDLGADSLLEPVTSDDGKFRVTMYDPSALDRTHCAGRHQYLIAREAVEADVIINVPKLKTHKKAGLTAALKNLVGINGHKEYLPHHRKGGAGRGGDCYDGDSLMKRVVEEVLDYANRAGRSTTARYMAGRVARAALAGETLAGGDANVEGSWHGNDTVWRMALDLSRIAYYGAADGQLAETKQRKVLSITDGIIAGDGEGPMACGSVPLGMVTLGSNTAAVDWVHAHLMQFDAARIPLVRESFGAFRWPIANFAASEIVASLNGAEISPRDLSIYHGRPFAPPSGWASHCELTGVRA